MMGTRRLSALTEALHSASRRHAPSTSRLVATLVVVGAVVTAAPQAASASFGIVPGSFSATPANEDGTTDRQAGSHPFSYVVSFEMNHDASEAAEGSAKDVLVNLPPGLVGAPAALPRCPRVDFDQEVASCPGDSQVGTLSANFREPGSGSLAPVGPVYNLVPPKGVAASFGFNGEGFIEIENASLVHGRHGYAVEVTSANVPQRSLLSLSETIWGVPAAKAHDAERECFEGHLGCPSEAPPTPFLTLPTDCDSGAASELAIDSTEDPGEYLFSESPFPLLTGCSGLEFRPTITVRPEASATDTPTGLSVDLHIPQTEVAGALAEADLKDATVALPAGLVVNPSIANGLATCSSANIEIDGIQPPRCPAASEIGTVEVDTPLISHPLPGTVYAAAQGDNPFGSLLAIYIVIDDPVTGIVVKLAGHVEPDGQTGQLRTTFLDNPELPFEDLKVNFSGGPRAALITPSVCGTYTTETNLVPWTTPEVASASPTSSFETNAGAHGTGCAYNAASLPNSPSFTAGSAVPLAGAYSPFTLNLSRSDGSQPFRQLEVTLPPGLVGKLAGIPRCSEQELARASAAGRTGAEEQAQPSCSAASRIGSVTASAGAGPLPVSVTGQVYLAGPYEGAPFSLEIITPAVAGPFDLGVVVVRSALYISPVNAQVTVKSDPIPMILQGIPLDLRSIAVDIDRPQFTLNPTSCARMNLTGVAASALGALAPLSDPFQVGGCQGLPFKPLFTVSTSGKTSKAAGASLITRVSFPRDLSSGGSTEANIAKVHVELPKQLPSRLTTLQKACTERQFDADPAGCPPESIVGHAVAHTPILTAALEGPAYFVSHGGAAFPELVMILQGEGVTIQLHGKTDIKKGITSSTFNQVPDAPVESFELALPEGPHSVLAAPGGNLCQQKLIMPTSVTGQNGALFTQRTSIEVEDCPDKIAVTRHEIDKRTLTISLYVPAAGKVTIGGRGLHTKAKTVEGRQTLTLAVGQTRAGRMSTKLRVTYLPKKGKRQVISFGLKFKK
jgi:hypothetical protein